MDEQKIRKIIGEVIRAELSKFRLEYSSFRSKRVTDTPTDSYQITSKNTITTGFLPITGGTITGGLTVSGTLNVNTDLAVTGKSGFYGTSPVSKPTVTGSRAGNAALASFLTALASEGLITDSTSA